MLMMTQKQQDKSVRHRECFNQWYRGSKGRWERCDKVSIRKGRWLLIADIGEEPLSNGRSNWWRLD